MEKVDLLIKNCAVLTMNRREDFFANGAVAIKNGKIVAVGSENEIVVSYQGEKNIDGNGKLALPGLINTHTHAAMVYFRGLADDLPLKEWLENYIWPAEAKYVNPDFIRKAIRLACLEMLKGGITSFCDMYFAEDEAAEEIEKIRQRAFLGEGLLDFPTPISKTPEEGLKRVENFIFSFKQSKLIFPVIAPHAVYTCSKELLKKAKDLAEKHQVLLHIHLAEEAWEVEKIKKEFDATPVEYLNSLGFLGEKVSLAHANWLEEKDIEILAKTKTGVSHNPESNMKLATGVCPVPKLISKGVSVGLGTDGASSNNNLDLFGEMSTTARLHKIWNKDPACLKAKEVVKMATIWGAEALGVADYLGSLETGKLADLVLLNIKKPHLVPVFDFYSHLVYAAKSSDVDTVIVNGEIVVENGQCLTLSEEEVLAEALEFGEKVRKDLGIAQNT